MTKMESTNLRRSSFMTVKSALLLAGLAALALAGCNNPLVATAKAAAIVAASPRLQLSSESGALNASDIQNFGGVSTGANSQLLVVTIENSGKTALKIDLSAITLTMAMGTEPSSFWLETPPPASIAPGGVEKLTLGFKPVSPGLKKATVVIPTNDVDNQKFIFTVEGTGLSTGKDITAFSIVGLSSAAAISGSSISLSVPYLTPLTERIASFTTTGVAVTVGGVAQTSNTTVNSFSSPLIYTVTAADGSHQDYTVNVTAAQSSSKSLDSFGFAIPQVQGIISGTSISVTLPYGTSRSGLAASFSYSGESLWVGTTRQSSGTTVNDFNTPVTYTLKAADGTSRDYIVAVAVATNPSKLITAFSIFGSTGSISESAHSINVSLPYGTILNPLTATFTTTGASVSVGGNLQTSAVTPNDFSSPLSYIVTALDGLTANYTVTVVASPSDSKTITAFSFSGITGQTQTISQTGSGGSIQVSVPYGTSLSGLKAIFTTTGKSVTASGSSQTSGISTGDFSGPVTYTVTAADNSSASYAVTVSVYLLIPSVTTSQISSVTASTATGGGAITSAGGDPVTSSGLCWGFSQNPDLSTCAGKTNEPYLSGSWSNSQLGSLLPGTTYYVRAYATNSVGTGFGLQVGFTSAALIPSLTTAAISAVTTATAMGGGAITSDGGATVTVSGLCWDTAQNPNLSSPGKTTDGNLSGSWSSSPLNSLLTGMTYYVRAYATNSVGTGYGPQVVFTTAASIPSLTTGSIGAVTTITATGGGAITGNGGAAITVSGLCWGTTQNPDLSSCAGKTSDGFLSGSWSSSPLSSLIAGTIYYVRAYATNSAGTGYGAQVGFTTLPVAPGAPSVSAVTGASGSQQLAVSWSAVTGAMLYEVYCNTTSTMPFATATGGTDIAATSCTLTGLTNYSSYYVWVVAKGASGSSGPSSASSPTMVGVKVASITLNKNSAMFLYGSSETITATCSPSTATQTAVNWTVTSGPSYASVVNGTVTGGNATGAATISVSAVDGQGAPAMIFTASTKAYTTNTAGPAGGYLFYDSLSYGTKGWRYMEAASNNVGANHTWYNGTGINIVAAQGTDFGTGLTNTTAIIAAQGEGTYMASDCRNYSQNGYSDWFMPSMNEANSVLAYVTSLNWAATLYIFESSSQYQYSSLGFWGFKCYDSPHVWAAMTTYYDSGTITRPVRQF